MGNGSASRERHQQRREGLRISRGIEPRSMPVALEHDVIVATDDQRERAVLAGVARGGLECLGIELLHLRRHARRGRHVPAGNPLARRRREVLRPQQRPKDEREERDPGQGEWPCFH